MEYEPDFRQQIADSWPRKICDKDSKIDWGLCYDVSVDELAEKILDGIDPKYKQNVAIQSLSSLKQ